MPARISLDVQGRIEGDRWWTTEPRHPDAQVSLIERRVVTALTGGEDSTLHVPGDNLIVDLALGFDALPVGTRLDAGTAQSRSPPRSARFRARLGDDALRWVNAAEHRARRLRGVYARVIRSGALAIGDPIAHAS